MPPFGEGTGAPGTRSLPINILLRFIRSPCRREDAICVWPRGSSCSHLCLVADATRLMWTWTHSLESRPRSRAASGGHHTQRRRSASRGQSKRIREEEGAITSLDLAGIRLLLKPDRRYKRAQSRYPRSLRAWFLALWAALVIAQGPAHGFVCSLEGPCDGACRHPEAA